jgi:hypothetical protein
LQLTLPPRTQGQRPPPFDGPPTAIGCGGESEWEGDQYAYTRAIQKFMDFMAAAAVITEWTIETLALQEEIASQNRYLESFKWHTSSGRALDLGYDAAMLRLQLLEDKAYHNPKTRIGAIQFDAGWIGPQDPTTLMILSEVRVGLTMAWRQLRVGHDAIAESSKTHVDEVLREIDKQLEQLFRISGPDEATWLTEIGKLFEAARVLRERAYRLQRLLPEC